MAPARRDADWSNSPAAHTMDATARAVGTRVTDVRRGEGRRYFATIDFGEKQSRGSFEHRPRRTPQEVGKAHEHGVLATANGQDQAAVGIEFDAETRRPAAASQTREHALEERGASRDKSVAGGHALGTYLTRPPETDKAREVKAITLQSVVGEATLERGAWLMASVLAADGRRSDVLLGFLSFVHGIARAFNGVVEIVFIAVQLRTSRGQFVQHF